MDSAVTAGTRQVLPGLAAAVATVAVAVAGLRVPGLGGIDAIGFDMFKRAMAADPLARGTPCSRDARSGASSAAT